MRFFSTIALAVAATAAAAPVRDDQYDLETLGHHGKECDRTPKFSTYPGYGEDAYKQFHYTQAVRIGDVIQTAGQGGWDPNTSVILKGRDAQLDQMFKNVELALKHAGGSGWDEVYHVRSYHIPLDDDTLQAMADRFKEWMPGKNKPVWTASAVVSLAFPGQVAEMDVEAFSPCTKKKSSWWRIM